MQPGTRYGPCKIVVAIHSFRFVSQISFAPQLSLQAYPCLFPMVCLSSLIGISSESCLFFNQYIFIKQILLHQNWRNQAIYHNNSGNSDKGYSDYQKDYTCSSISSFCILFFNPLQFAFKLFLCWHISSVTGDISSVFDTCQLGHFLPLLSSYDFQELALFCPDLLPL